MRALPAHPQRQSSGLSLGARATTPWTWGRQGSRAWNWRRGGFLRRSTRQAIAIFTPHEGSVRDLDFHSEVCQAKRSVHHGGLALWHPDEVAVGTRLAEEAEIDAMESFVKRKKAPRWLGHAIDHRSATVLAYGFGRRQDEVLLKRKARLEPVGHHARFHGLLGASRRHLEADAHEPGKRNTQKIARKHLTLRTRITRLARQTIGFSTSIQMHDMVTGLFVNRYECGLLFSSHDIQI